MIVPPYPINAFKTENVADLSGFFDYMAVFTLTHYPVGVMPVTEVLEGED